MASQQNDRRRQVEEPNAWSSDHSSHAEGSSKPVPAHLAEYAPSTSNSLDKRILKRKAGDEFTVEELPDSEDIGYDADIEIRLPDEYDEPDSDQASIGKSEPGAGVHGDGDSLEDNDDDRSDDAATTESRIVEKLRRLNCDPIEMTRRTKYRRSFRAARRRSRGNSLKRSFSQSLGSGSDLEDPGGILIDDILLGTRRQRRRVDARRPKAKLENEISPPDEVQNSDHVGPGQTVSSPSDSTQPPERMFVAVGAAEAMDVDSQGSDLGG